MSQLFVPLPEYSHESIRLKILGAQKGMTDRMAKKNGNVHEYYKELRKKLPKDVKTGIRNVVNDYRPPKSEDEPQHLYPDSLPAEHGLTIGAILGLRIVPRKRRSEYLGRTSTNLGALHASLPGSASDLSDIMLLGSGLVVPLLHPSLATREPEASPIATRRNRIYATGIGYMASAAVVMLVETELNKAQHTDVPASSTIERDIAWLAAAEIITRADLPSDMQ